MYPVEKKISQDTFFLSKIYCLEIGLRIRKHEGGDRSCQTVLCQNKRNCHAIDGEIISDSQMESQIQSI